MRYYMLTLGCAKNVADSDGIGSLMASSGYAPSERAEDADVLLVNTCGFLQASRQESLAALRVLGEQKRRDQVLIAAGCLISRYGQTVQSQVPQVDAVIDAGRWLALPRLIEYVRSGESGASTNVSWLDEAYAGLPADQVAARSVVERLGRAPRGPSAYLKIADGCDRPCTFCIIPAIKGAHRSKPADTVVAEARDLTSQGVKEIVLVAQDTTAYGWDLGMRDALAPLIDRLCNEVDGLSWLRLMYAYPGHVTPRLVETLARYPQITHYIDVPLQHAHPDTLKRMKRPNLVVTRQMLDALRVAMPDLAIRTTFIVGFPGETQGEFQSLVRFLQEQQFDRVGVLVFARRGNAGGADGAPGLAASQVAAPRRSDGGPTRDLTRKEPIVRRPGAGRADRRRWRRRQRGEILPGCAGSGRSSDRERRIEGGPVRACQDHTGDRIRSDGRASGFQA
ncbi:MAG: MiaB/RimO family radical SAM methylthiotransferase [Chloroflexi bacterium]|nr:MiaB/RimO family radical SAM methylthiotransferase [Chloroflexota bacterium]